MAKAGEETQISCRFITKLPDVYRVPTSTVVRIPACSRPESEILLKNLYYAFLIPIACWNSQAVPSQLHRYGLSQIINHLLALGEALPHLSATHRVRCSHPRVLSHLGAMCRTSEAI